MWCVFYWWGISCHRKQQFFRTIHKPQEWILSHNAVLIVANKTMLGQANIYYNINVKKYMRKITWFQWWSFGRRKWVDLIMTAGFWDQMKAWRLSCCLHPSIWLHIIVWDQFSENNKWNGAFDSSEYEYAKHVPHLNTNMQNVWRVTYHYVWVLGNQLNNGLCSICMHPLFSLPIVLLDL
jgi:hypothetical protein